MFFNVEVFSHLFWGMIFFVWKVWDGAVVEHRESIVKENRVVGAFKFSFG